jgi:hypothetical protein
VNLKCMNGEDIKDDAILVCHHCGMPVCQQHGWTVATDDAFGDSNTPISRISMHCRECMEEYHKGLVRQRGWPTTTVAQPPSQAGAG